MQVTCMRFSVGSQQPAGFGRIRQRQPACKPAWCTLCIMCSSGWGRCGVAVSGMHESACCCCCGSCCCVCDALWHSQAAQSAENHTLTQKHSSNQHNTTTASQQTPMNEQNTHSRNETSNRNKEHNRQAYQAALTQSTQTTPH